MKNQSEIEIWNGAVGERWATLQELLDRHIRVFGLDVLAVADLRTGERVLDVGAGCADMTIDAAKRVGPAGHVVGVDVSRPMLARGRERASGLANLELIEHDASTFVPDAPFDVVLSRFGVMFFDEPALAFTNIRSAAKPGARLAFACWQELGKNPWAAVPLEAVLRVVAAKPASAPDAPGPFAFADPARIRDVLANAGWSNVAIAPASHLVPLGATLEDAVEFSSRSGPAARAVREADAAQQPAVLAAIREALAPHGPSVALQGAAWIVTATA